MQVKFMRELKEVSELVKGGNTYTGAIREVLKEEPKPSSVKRIKSLAMDYYG